MHKKIVMLVAVTCLAGPRWCPAESSGRAVRFEVTADAFRKYVWRGQNLVDGWGNKKCNAFYWGTDRAERNDLVLSVGFPFEVAGVTVTPGVSYIALLDSDVKESNAYGRENSIVVASLSLARDF